MKKALILAVTAAAALAGTQALAANFTEGDFVRSYFNESNTYMWDLGAAPAAGALAADAFTGAAQAGNITFWSFDTATGNGSFSWDSNTFDLGSYNNGGAALFYAQTVYTHNQNSNYYAEASVGSQGYAEAFKGGFDFMFTDIQGHMGDFTGTAGETVTQYLYQFNYNGSDFTVGNGGLYAYQLDTTFANGNFTTVATANSPAPVPVPGAVVLLGSGLAGLLGIRRKVS